MNDHGLRRRAARRPPERAARRSSPRCAPSSSTGSRPPACRGSRRSASSTRSACRRWRAPRRWSRRSSAQPGVVYAGLALNERGYDRLRATGLDEVHFAFAVDREVQPAQRRRVGRGVGRRRRADRRARARRRHPRDRRRSARRSAARSRAPSTPAASLGARRRGSPRPARTRSSSPTRSASASRRRCGGSSAAARSSACPVGVHLHNTRNTGFANALGGARGRGDRARRVGRRDRRLPVRAEGDGQHRHRGPRLPAARRGRRDGDRPRRADRGRRLARGRARAAAPGQVYRAGAFAPVSG